MVTAVAVLRGGRTYHRLETIPAGGYLVQRIRCRPRKPSWIELTLEWAEHQGYTACRNCYRTDRR